MEFVFDNVTGTIGNDQDIIACCRVAFEPFKLEKIVNNNEILYKTHVKNYQFEKNFNSKLSSPDRVNFHQNREYWSLVSEKQLWTKFFVGGFHAFVSMFWSQMKLTQLRSIPRQKWLRQTHIVTCYFEVVLLKYFVMHCEISCENSEISNLLTIRKYI